MKYGFAPRILPPAGGDTTRAIREKQSVVRAHPKRFDLAFAARPRRGGQAVIAPYRWISIGRFLPIELWTLGLER